DRQQVTHADVVARAGGGQKQHGDRHEPKTRVASLRPVSEQRNQTHGGDEEESKRALEEERHEEIGGESLYGDAAEQVVDTPSLRVLGSDGGQTPEVVADRRGNGGDPLDRRRQPR